MDFNFNDLYNRIKEMDQSSAPAQPAVEGKMSDVDMIMQSIVQGHKEIYNVMNDPQGPEEEATAKILRQMYDQVASENGLHPDDDFEEIENLMHDLIADTVGVDGVSYSEPPTEEVQVEADGLSEEPIEECPMDDDLGAMNKLAGLTPTSAPASSPAQQDSVNVNISMSGSGKGGIRDLLDVLRNIDGDDDSDEPEMNIDLDPDMDNGMNKVKQDMDALVDNRPMDEYANTPDEAYADVSAVTPSGDDLHASHKSYADKPYRGDNPMAETLIASLQKRYDEIVSESKAK